MKILHLVDSLGLGGTQVVLKGLFEQQWFNRDMHLYSLRTVAPELTVSHPNVVIYPSSARFSLRPLRRLRAYIIDHGIEVIHCHLFRSQVFGFLLKRLWFPHALLVFHEHGRVVGRESESWLENVLFRWFLRTTRSHVDRFICISEYTRDALLALVPRAHGCNHIVYNPLSGQYDTSVTYKQARALLGVPEGSFSIGFAGRLVWRKGWKDFLDAIKKVSEHYPVYFLIAGEGEDRAKIESYIREIGLESQGRLLGYLSSMSEFYSALDCFVIPSHWEPHGLVHLEAQRAGVAVITSNIPGLRETITDGRNVLLFESGDAKDLANKIISLILASDLRQTLAEAGRQNAMRFSMERFVGQLEAIYLTSRVETGVEKGTS